MVILNWQRWVDFIVLTVALYFVLHWARRARALRLAVGVLGLQVLAFLAGRLGLFVTSWILHIAGILLAALILLLFQSELRQALMRVDSLLRGRRQRSKLAKYAAVSKGAFELASAGLGALMVLPRNDAIDEVVAAGMPLTTPVTSEVLLAIFQRSSPLHDGAAIIQGDRVSAVNVVLPLTTRTDLPWQFGTRHRAAIGLTEQCDAVVIVVSEERSEVRVAHLGTIEQVGSTAELAAGLRTLFGADTRVPLLARTRAWVKTNAGQVAAAASISAAIWLLTFFSPRTTVRSLSAPVEFVNVPSGLVVLDQSAGRVQVDIRGASWLVDSTSSAVVARIDLTGAKPGARRIHLTGKAFHLDPGLALDRVDPADISVHLARSTR